MSKVIEIIADSEGNIRMIYDDNITPVLAELGDLKVRRASHVEPCEDGLGWIADLSPVCGPSIGPFSLRKDALEAEVDWLKSHNTPVPNGMK